MNPEKQKLAPGLYLVATPIGNARDITLRALDVLASADVLTAEDTRTLRKLMEIHGIPLDGRRVVAYHDHSSAPQRDRILAAVRDGKSVAYASEAGTPLIADPGYRLVQEAGQAGLKVIAVPGASAVLTALTTAGLPTDRFTFAGFPPTAKGARRTFLDGLAGAAGTLVFYESPRRTADFLAAAAEALGPDRPAALARELTKKFEEVRRGSLAELADGVVSDPPRGEVVVLIGSAPDREPDVIAVAAALDEAMERLSVKDAAAEVAERFGLGRRAVYQQALKLRGD